MTIYKRPLFAGIGFIFALLAWFGLSGGAMANQPSEPLSRTLEPVILSGGQLPDYTGAPLDDLFAYAYHGDQWTPIPFQIDEVDASGTYTVENGVLDDNDELVFMSMDAGEQVSASEWLTDTNSQENPRYELLVSNPLAPAEQGWVYLSRSSTLTPAPTPDYVNYDPVSQRFVAGAYVVGFDSASHAGIDSLELNDSGVDVLDRSKIRVNADCYIAGFPINMTLTEEDLAGQIDPAPDIDGPVRAGGGTLQASSWAYYALNQSHIGFDLANLEPPPPCESIVVKWIRLSNDWLDPVACGMAPMTYFDANTPGGVPVDGNPDGVSPLWSDWRQVSGGRGSVVSLAETSLGGGTLSSYYKDDQVQDPTDTGDQQSFGDAGAVVNAPSGQVSVDMLTYVLGADQPNVGGLLKSYYENPLQVSALGQSYQPPEVGFSFFLPMVKKALNVER